MNKLYLLGSYFFVFLTVLSSCSKQEDNSQQGLSLLEVKVNGHSSGFEYSDVGSQPSIELRFSVPLDESSINQGISVVSGGGEEIAITAEATDEGRGLEIKTDTLLSFTTYTLNINRRLSSGQGASLAQDIDIRLRSGLDSTDKFERISDEELLNKVQQQTFKYFWDFAHPVSGMIRERNTSLETVTTGGTGFGLMALIVGSERGFVSRSEAYERTRKIVDFLHTKAERFHGAFSHWLDGSTGRTLPFSEKDNGADLVETSLLMQGMLASREYFNRADESDLRDVINDIWHSIDWGFFRRDAQQVLYWHWSPDFGWGMNLQINGWNESLITYVLAAGSPASAIPSSTYHEGWARNGAMRNGRSFFDISLPLGTDFGGPLFLSQYSFLGINPFGLSDNYADYASQVKAHTLINRAHCVANPNNFYGYSADCWGLTASDDINGYRVHSPSEDNSVITPTAALASMPFTPEESKQALRFFYYKLGDRLWGDYGFIDAFSIHESWFADSYIAIDQGPIIIMIENYRSGLLWNLFSNAPEIKSSLSKLGFTRAGN